MQTWESLGISTRGATSGEIDTTCPWCSAQRKKKQARCLSINLDKGVYHCSHCGISGGLGIGQRIGQTPWKKPEWRRPEPVKEAAKDPVIEWFGSRGIPADVVTRNKIVSTSVYMPQAEERRGVIAFPYCRNGELINYKYRDREKNFRMEAQAERILYGYDDIDDKCCVVVEGEMDKLTVEVAGITSCVSVPDGAPTPESKTYASKFTFLDDERLEKVKSWLIAVDSDLPGVRLEQELVRRLGIAKCRKVVWPEGCKDANEVLSEHGSDEVKRCLSMAKPYPIEGVVEVNDLASQIEALYQQGVLRGLSTGWKGLDPLYTVRPGEWTVVTGIPSSGKSNWVDALMVNLAKEHGWRFVVFSPENQPLQNHVSRLMEHFTQLPFRVGPTQRMDVEQMHVARDWLNEFFRFVLPPDDDRWTVDNILAIALVLIRRHGINGIVIDPWNEMEHNYPSSMSETQYISKTLKKLRQFTRRNAVHIWMVAHPTKMFRNKDGEYPIPTLYDISGSSHWRNKADNGIVVWRDFNNPDSPRVQIHSQKIRFREVGRIGVAELQYNIPTGGYYDLPQNQPVDPPEETDASFFWEK